MININTSIQKQEPNTWHWCDSIHWIQSREQTLSQIGIKFQNHQLSTIASELKIQGNFHSADSDVQALQLILEEIHQKTTQNEEKVTTLLESLVCFAFKPPTMSATNTKKKKSQPRPFRCFSCAATRCYATKAALEEHERKHHGALTDPKDIPTTKRQNDNSTQKSKQTKKQRSTPK